MAAGGRSQGCCHQISDEAREWGIWLKGEGHKMKYNQQSEYFLVEGRVQARGILGKRQLIDSEKAARGKNRRVLLYNHAGVTAGLFGGCSTLSTRDLGGIGIEKKKMIFGIDSMTKDPRNKRTVRGEEMLEKVQLIILIKSIESNLIKLWV